MTIIAGYAGTQRRRCPSDHWPLRVRAAARGRRPDGGADAFQTDDVLLGSGFRCCRRDLGRPSRCGGTGRRYRADPPAPLFYCRAKSIADTAPVADIGRGEQPRFDEGVQVGVVQPDGNELLDLFGCNAGPVCAVAPRDHPRAPRAAVIKPASH